MVASRRPFNALLNTSFLIACLTVTPLVGADDSTTASPSGSDAVSQRPLDPQAQAIADRLGKSLAEGSEARAMYETIVRGEPLGPDSGWWRVSKSQTRFGWSDARERFDADQDGRVQRQEFSGSAADFRRLDGNGDGVFTKADHDGAGQSLEKTGGFGLFVEGDADADGKVTRQEFLTLFDRWDEGSLGFLAPSDLRHRLPTGESKERSADSRRRGPDTATLLRGLAGQEIGSLQAGPAVGENAPDFTLPQFDGASDITLSETVGDQPVVLIFGNFTCGPFRRQSGNLQKLHARYGDRAEFLMVYVREAHPTDGWASNRNARHGIRVSQPATDQQRREVAARCAAHLDLPFPMLVDHVDDRVGARYSGMPNRLYLIDADGRIAFKSGRGPFGFRPRELEQALVLLLNDPQPTR